MLIAREIAVGRALSLQQFCADADVRLGLDVGTALLLVRHLLATRQLVCDMTRPISDTVSISVFKSAEAPQKKGLA
jgi:TnsA endonuclease C terminal